MTGHEAPPSITPVYDCLPDLRLPAWQILPL